jgi:orotate phosphoribosyltransferase
MMDNGLSKSEVIDFLVQSQALKFGDFTLKSGRKAPYFINTGCFDDGTKIAKLSHFYARQILAAGLGDVDVVFGPAYKGIPLCVSTAMTLASHYSTPMSFCFNRKEAKTRGEGGEYVGKPLTPGMKVVLVEDVVTAGTTLHEVIPVLREKVGVRIAGVVILVDRDEKATSEVSAVKQAEAELDIKITSIVTIHDIISYLSRENSSKFTIDEDLMKRVKTYRSEFGAS